MKRRAYTVVEILIAVTVALLAFVTFLSVFRSSYEYASQTRDRAIGTVLSRSLLEEVEAHPYGMKSPKSWTTVSDSPAQIWIQGRPVEMVFHKQFTYMNGSFVGNSTADSDIVTITLGWHESTGTAVNASSGNSADNRQMVVTVPVWR